MGRVSVEVELANGEDLVMGKKGTLPPDQIRRARMTAWVDTGSNYLVIPESVVQQLGLPETGQAAVRFADNRTEPRKVVNQVHVAVLGRDGTFKAIVEPGRTDMLLGAIALEDMDLLVNCSTQTLQPRDPTRIIAIVE